MLMFTLRFSRSSLALLLLAAASTAALAAPDKPTDIYADGVQVSEPAPAFSLPAFPDGTFKLADAQGSYVVLYFYPKDDTPGCTKEACAFRDLKDEFAKQDAVIWGVSRDSLDSHQAFAAKYALDFPLLSDVGGSVRKLFGNPEGAQDPLIMRITYVIDRQGIVRAVIYGSGPGDWQTHIDGAQKAIAALLAAEAKAISTSGKHT
jgi:thioredoxin-dependent peroxiredoxin